MPWLGVSSLWVRGAGGAELTVLKEFRGRVGVAGRSAVDEVYTLEGASSARSTESLLKDRRDSSQGILTTFRSDFQDDRSVFAGILPFPSGSGCKNMSLGTRF